MDREGMRFRNRMCDRNELDAKWTQIDATARLHDGDRNLGRIALRSALGLEQGGAEFSRVDRAFQLGPELDDGAEMVFVGVRQHQSH